MVWRQGTAGANAVGAVLAEERSDIDDAVQYCVQHDNFRSIMIIFVIHVLHIFVSCSSPEWFSNIR